MNIKTSAFRAFIVTLHTDEHMGWCELVLFLRAKNANVPTLGPRLLVRFPRVGKAIEDKCPTYVRAWYMHNIPPLICHPFGSLFNGAQRYQICCLQLRNQFSNLNFTDSRCPRARELCSIPIALGWLELKPLFLYDFTVTEDPTLLDAGEWLHFLSETKILFLRNLPYLLADAPVTLSNPENAEEYIWRRAFDLFGLVDTVWSRKRHEAKIVWNLATDVRTTLANLVRVLAWIHLLSPQKSIKLYANLLRLLTCNLERLGKLRDKGFRKFALVSTVLFHFKWY